MSMDCVSPSDLWSFFLWIEQNKNDHFKIAHETEKVLWYGGCCCCWLLTVWLGAVLIGTHRIARIEPLEILLLILALFGHYHRNFCLQLRHCRRLLRSGWPIKLYGSPKSNVRLKFKVFCLHLLPGLDTSPPAKLFSVCLY